MKSAHAEVPHLTINPSQCCVFRGIHRHQEMERSTSFRDFNLLFGAEKNVVGAHNSVRLLTFYAIRQKQTLQRTSMTAPLPRLPSVSRAAAFQRCSTEAVGTAPRRSCAYARRRFLPHRRPRSSTPPPLPRVAPSPAGLTARPPPDRATNTGL